MPTYTFKREECCGDQMQLWTDFMTIAEKEKYLKDNPDVRRVLVAPAIVSGVQGMTHKEDSGWKENMQRISEAHPNSPLAERYGNSESNAKKKARQKIDNRLGVGVSKSTKHNLNNTEVVGKKHTYKDV